MADMKHSIQIAAPLERVHPLVVSGNGFSQWWAADVTESRGLWSSASSIAIRSMASSPS